jgi:hypothetical protein
MREYPIHLYELMTRLGIEPGVSPRQGFQYAVALHRCDACQCKQACRAWLDHMPATVNLAPSFCVNADILFELRFDQPGPGRVGSFSGSVSKAA